MKILIYLPEKQVKTFTAREELPVVESSCPANGNTQRTEVNDLINSLDRKSRGLRHRLFGALQRIGVDGWAPLPPRPKKSRAQREAEAMEGAQASSASETDN